MVINELYVGGFFKPPRLIYQVYHMFFMVYNSIWRYLCHNDFPVCMRKPLPI